MVEYALSDFPCEVEAASLALDALDDVQALAAVPESVRENLVQFVFADVPEGCVSQIVSERDGFGEVFVEVKRARDGASNLADFEGVGEAGNIVVAEWGDENLSLVLEAANALLWRMRSRSRWYSVRTSEGGSGTARPADCADFAANGERSRSRCSRRRRIDERPLAVNGMSSCATLLSNAICVPTKCLTVSKHSNGCCGEQMQRTRCDRGKNT